MEVNGVFEWVRQVLRIWTQLAQLDMQPPVAPMPPSLSLSTASPYGPLFLALSLSLPLPMSLSLSLPVSLSLSLSLTLFLSLSTLSREIREQLFQERSGACQGIPCGVN